MKMASLPVACLAPCLSDDQVLASLCPSQKHQAKGGISEPALRPGRTTPSEREYRAANRERIESMEETPRI